MRFQDKCSLSVKDKCFCLFCCCKDCVALSVIPRGGEARTPDYNKTFWMLLKSS